MLTLLVLALLAPARNLGQTEDSATRTRFIVVDEAKSEAIQKAADSGYRVVAASSGAGKLLMERVASPPDTYRYLHLEGGEFQHSNLVGVENRINEAGAMSYRLLFVSYGEASALMEKAPHPHNFEYRVVSLSSLSQRHSGWLLGRREQHMPSLKGFEKREVTCLANPFRGLQEPVVIFERPWPAPGETPAREDTISSPHSLSVLNTLRISALEKELNRAAAQGLRVFGALQAWCAGGGKGGGITIVMAPVGSSEKYEYRMIPHKGLEDTEARLNKAGAEGFRLLLQTLVAKGMAMERATGGGRQYAYRLVRIADPSRLETELTQAAREGFSPVGTLYAGGAAVILQKQSPASPK